MDKEKLLKLSKILVLVFMSLTFINVLLPDSFIIGIHRLESDLGMERFDPFQMIIRWFNFTSFVVLPIAVFYDRKVFKKVAIYFCLPIAIIYFALIGQILPCYTNEAGTGIVDIRYLPEFVTSLMHNGVLRGIIFVLMSLTQLATIGLLIYRDWEVVKFKKNEILPFVLLLVASIITILPIYALEGIFNTYTDEIFDRFSILHIVWIVSIVVELIVATVVFKKRSYEDRYILVLILSLSLFLQFNQLFSSLGELTCKRMPFQLCNIAAYLTLISVVTKNRNLFLFNILINVAGGLIALFVLDVPGDEGILSKGNIHYIVEHHNVIIAPLLALILGIFKPITWKDFKAYVLYFTGYYAFVFILGTIFNTIYNLDTANNGYFYCNYLFMFDQATATKLVGFAGQLFDFKFNIGPVTIYYVIQPLVYIAFFAIGTGMFILLKWAVKEKEEEVEKVQIEV